MKFVTQRRLFLATILSLANVQANEESIRDTKHFSLFSVVTFKNEECSSESTLAGGQIHGTCFTATECGDKGGTKSGNCASGFGVCCVFISNTGATATISQNRTYIRNPLFPSAETTVPSAITYTIQKMQDDICQVRLDFDNFVIAGPSVTNELNTDGVVTMCKDAMATTLSSSCTTSTCTAVGVAIPTLCGVMTNEHLYLDLGDLAADTATLAFTFAAATVITATNAQRSWSIKTSHIPCWAPYRAPDGCHRYFMQNSGQVISPNFMQLSTDTTRTAAMLLSGMDLTSQNIKSCIRREKNMCCVKFQVCNQYNGADLSTSLAGGANVNDGVFGAVISQGFSFLIDYTNIGGVPNGYSAADAAHLNQGLVDGFCTGDYIEIPDSTTGLKNNGAVTQVNTRYCGHRLGNLPSISANTFVHAPVYDCTEPFEVTYRTDQMSDEGDAGAASTQTIESRGLCLDFTQEAC